MQTLQQKKSDASIERYFKIHPFGKYYIPYHKYFRYNEANIYV